MQPRPSTPPVRASAAAAVTVANFEPVVETVVDEAPSEPVEPTGAPGESAPAAVEEKEAPAKPFVHVVEEGETIRMLAARFSLSGPVSPAGARLRGRQQAFALGALAGQLAGAAHGFRLLAGALLRGLLVVHVALHLTEAAFALHLLLQGLQGLIDVVVADENLNQVKLSFGRPPRPVRETGRQINLVLPGRGP